MMGSTSDNCMSNVQNSAGTLRIRYLLGILVALITVDALISQFLMKSGLGREVNPLMEPFVGEHVFIPLKVFGAMLCAFILWDIHRRWPKLALVATSCFVSIYCGIVLWNIASVLLPRFRHCTFQSNG